MKILGINAFHGQLSVRKKIDGRPVGGAAVLGAYLRDAASGFAGRFLVVHAGDQVGASPPASALLKDEPSIEFLNLLSNEHCSTRSKMDPLCNVVGTLGNHEFDRGKDELLRLLNGGNSSDGPFLETPYRGARFPYVNANVVYTNTGATLLPPFVVRIVGGVPIGVIGAVLRETPTIVTPTGVAELSFKDEVESINLAVVALRKMGVRTILVTIHQGGSEPTFPGPTRVAGAVSGPISDIVARLDDEVDVVLSGHTHAFTNAFIPTRNGKQILVTQALSAGVAFGDIDLEVDVLTRDVVRKSARIVTTFADVIPGNAPAVDIRELVSRAEGAVAPLVNQVVAHSSTAVTAAENAAGESAMGDLISDAQRAAMHADFAFMNPGGIRADLDAGPVTWGELFTIQPFGNSLVKLSLTGAQVVALLEQQWLGQPRTRFLQISGLTYTWDAAQPVGHRVVDVRKGGTSIDPNTAYTATVNNFMAQGGDNFTVLTQGKYQTVGPLDLDAFIAHIKALPQPFTLSVGGRVTRLN